MIKTCKASLLAIGLISPLPVLHAAPPPGFELVWADDFEGDQLDVSRWIYRTDSKHWSTQRPENISVRNGRLVLALKKESLRGKDYTGAGVISRETFRYGYYEAKMKMPDGAGWHSSFWLMKHDGQGGTGTGPAAQELDICEQDSISPDRYEVNTHTWNPAPHREFGRKAVMTPKLSADFHVYGCEFTPETVKYFFDGDLVATVDATQFAHGDQHIWLTSIATHLGNTTAVDDTKLPARVEVDWVRFFAKRSLAP